MKGVFRYCLVLVVVFVLVLTVCVGCTGGNSSLSIGVTVGSFDDASMEDVRNRIKSYFEELSTDKVDYTVDILGANGDANEQLLQVDGFIAEKYDVMIVSLLSPSFAGKVTEKAKAAGMPVVFLKFRPGEETMNSWNKTCFVGFDYHQMGFVQGEIIANLPNNGDVNGDGVVSFVMITGEPIHPDVAYLAECSIKALTDRGIVVERLIRQSGDWDYYKGYDIAADAISQFGDRIDVIFCHNDDMAFGASKAISEAGRTVNKDIYLVGWGATSEGIDRVNNGLMTGTVRIDDDSRAVAAAEAAIRFARGKGNDKYIWIDYVPIIAEID